MSVGWSDREPARDRSAQPPWQCAPGVALVRGSGGDPLPQGGRRIPGKRRDPVKRAVQLLREGQYLRVNDERLEVPDIEAMRRLYTLLGVKDEIRGDG